MTAPEPDSKITILLIKNNPILLTRFENMLKKEGFGVDSSVTLSDALEKIRNHHYDVIITNTTFYGVEREDVVPLIKVFNPTIPILVFSLKKNIHSLIKAANLGADDFFVNPTELTTRLKLLLSKKKRIAEQHAQLSI